MIASEELQEQTGFNVKAADSRPKFLSRKEREELQKQLEERQKVQQVQKEQEIAEIRKEYEQFKQKKQEKRRSRSRSKSHEKNNRYINGTTKAKNSQDEEVQNIKMHYLGLNKEKRKILKPSEKFKNIFNFEWDAAEDTSTNFNPLVQKVHAEVDVIGSDHWSKKQTQQLTQRDWRIFREDNDIIIKGGRVPNPIREWSEVILPKVTMDAIKRLQYIRPTPIQMQTIPIGLERKDLIGIAPTGSGKSAAFLIPLITYLLTLPRQDDRICKDGPYALIMAPSRELAMQIEEEFLRLSAGTGLRSFVVVGGRREEEQALHLKQGIEVLIGTPGRIKECLMKKFLVLDQCTWAILDEADKMIDLGFEIDVNYILDSITTLMKSDDEHLAELQERQAIRGEKEYRVTHLFSATMPNQVEKLAKKYLRAFCFISIGEPGGGKKDIEQVVEMISESSKKHRLLQLLQQQKGPIILFANQKKSVELLQRVLEKYNWNSVVYHGGKTQQQREAAVEGFKTGKFDILIATDLASRGLHVEGVKMVINFDAPSTIENYVHRIGRTGRAGKKGLAVTFLTNNDQELFYDLKDFLLKNSQHVPNELGQHPASVQRQTPDNVPRRKQVILAHGST